MGRTLRSTLVAVVVAVVFVVTAATVGGCSSDPEQTAVDEAVAQAQQVTAFCDAARANIEAAKPLADLNADGPAPHPADQLAAAIEPLRESNQAMLDAAPAQVRPDAELAHQLAEMQLSIYESSGGDATAVSADAGYVAKVRETDASIKRMQGFLRTVCRIDAS